MNSLTKLTTGLNILGLICDSYKLKKKKKKKKNGMGTVIRKELGPVVQS